MEIIATHINPNRALGDQSGFGTVLQLCCNESQHVLAATKESNAGGIIYVRLSLVEALLSNLSAKYRLIMVGMAYKSILLTAGAVTGVWFQKAPVDEFEICFNCTDRPSFALRLQSKGKDGSNQDAHEA
jgi:hypothetical protein